jgi:hypothetical protein
MNNCKILPALAAVVAVTAGVAKADQRIIGSDLYFAGATVGYWLITSVVDVENPPGRWVYCVDISPALGSAGGDALHPQYYVVEMGEGGWAWDDKSGRSNPCLQVQRTVALTTAPDATGTSVPGPRGSGQSGASSGDSGGLFDDLRRSGR